MEHKVWFLFFTERGFRYALPSNFALHLVKMGEEKTRKWEALHAWGC